MTLLLLDIQICNSGVRSLCYTVMWPRSATVAVLIAGATSVRARRPGSSGEEGEGDFRETSGVRGRRGEGEEGGGGDRRPGLTIGKTAW